MNRIATKGFHECVGATDTPLFEKTDNNKPIGAAIRRVKNIIGQPAERGASPLLYAAASPDVEGELYHY